VRGGTGHPLGDRTPAANVDYYRVKGPDLPPAGPARIGRAKRQTDPTPRPQEATGAHPDPRQRGDPRCLHEPHLAGTEGLHWTRLLADSDPRERSTGSGSTSPVPRTATWGRRSGGRIRRAAASSWSTWPGGCTPPADTLTRSGPSRLHTCESPSSRFASPTPATMLTNFWNATAQDLVRSPQSAVTWIRWGS